MAAADQLDVVTAARLVASAGTFEEDSTAKEVVKWAVDTFGEGLVLQTSAGIDSSVMLKLVTSVSPNVKVVFVDTGYLPVETLEYMETLHRELNLNLTIARPQMTPEELEAEHGRLWESNSKVDLALYGEITKVEPMNRALQELGATAVLTGLRSHQTANRAGMSKISFDISSKRFKVLPILEWSKDDVTQYQKSMALPQHPLAAKGFATVGDSHSSRALKAGDTNERSTRFNGKTQECGLHTETVPLNQLIQLLQTPPPLPDGYVLFTKPDCKYCKAAKALLREQGATFIERDVTDDLVRAEMQIRLPRAKTVPQIFQSNSHIGGFTDLHAMLDTQVEVDTYVKLIQTIEQKAHMAPRSAAGCALSCLMDMGFGGPLGKLHCEAQCAQVA